MSKPHKGVSQKQVVKSPAREDHILGMVQTNRDRLSDPEVAENWILMISNVFDLILGQNLKNHIQNKSFRLQKGKFCQNVRTSKNVL